MVAPFTKTVEETKANIKKIEHNSMGTYGPPTAIEGGSGANTNTGTTEGVPPKKKGDDWA
jgi:hypothetical protein